MGQAQFTTVMERMVVIRVYYDKELNKFLFAGCIDLYALQFGFGVP